MTEIEQKARLEASERVERFVKEFSCFKQFESIIFEYAAFAEKEYLLQIENLEKENAKFKKQCSDYDKWVNQPRD